MKLAQLLARERMVIFGGGVAARKIVSFSLIMLALFWILAGRRLPGYLVRGGLLSVRQSGSFAAL